MNLDILLSKFLLFDFIRIKSKSKLFPIYLAVFLSGITCLIEFPRVLLSDFKSDIWTATVIKKNDLTNRLKEFHPSSHSSKKVFRLTVPALMKIFNLSPQGIVVIQVLLGILIFYFSYLTSLRILNDSISAAYFTLGIAFIYMGRSSFFDQGWFDPFAYFFLLMAINSRNSIFIFLFSLLAAWTDERAVISLIMVFFYHHLKNNFDTKLSSRSLLKFNFESISVFSAVLIYFLGRYILTIKLGMVTPTGGVSLSIFKENLIYMPIGLWTFLEGFWIIALISFIYTVFTKNYLLSFVFLFSSGLVAFVSFNVLDITRSGTYIFPLLFLSLHYLSKNVDTERLRNIIICSTCVSILFPAIFILKGVHVYDSTIRNIYYYFTN